MIMIVFQHFGFHSGFAWEIDSTTITHFWYNLIIMGGKIGVNLFVLISGYFLINSKGPLFNFKRILKFWGQVFFYSVTIFLIFGVCGMIDLNMKAAIKNLFPITFSSWWFASTYFVLFLIHPFLNQLLHSLDKKTYQWLLVLLVICWSIIPTFTGQQFQANLLLWFITIYAIGGYARNYGFNPKFSSKHYFGLWFVFSALTYLSTVVFTIMGVRWSFFASHATYFYGQKRISTLLISLTLFMAFATLKMRYHRWLNVIASATFGVYLIHDSEIIRPVLWESVFKGAQYQDSITLIPYSIVAVSAVYLVCTIIDLLRQRLFEKPYMAIVNRYSKSWLKPFDTICSFFKNIVFGN